MTSPTAKIQFVSDSSILVLFGDEPSSRSTDFVIAFHREVMALLKSHRVTNLHPAYASVLVDFDPRATEPESLKRELEKIAIELIPSPATEAGVVEIPVDFDADHGPDLGEVAARAGFTESEAIRVFSSAEYRVAFIGFSPGFPYLLGLPESLRGPRKATPRTRVLRGSVAIAGTQAGIYPDETPGGWQILGRARGEMFDPRRDSPSLLEPGQRVRFVAASASSEAWLEPRAASVTTTPDPILEVIAPGAFTTIQDGGRNGFAHHGVSAGGAADLFSLRLANLLVGNEDVAPALELTATGGEFRFLADSWFALAGADAEATLDGQSIAPRVAMPVCAGQRLRIGPMSRGPRAYLALRGGIATEFVAGGHGTHVAGRWGGWNGRALREGDRLSRGSRAKAAPTFRRWAGSTEDEVTLRVTRGPQADWFADSTREKFYSSEFVVGDEANRQGARLTGPDVSIADKTRELASEGVADGAIQVAGDGRPMILFCEQHTTGGYPKIANVIRADLRRVGQLKPGAVVRFREVSLPDAWAANAALERSLQEGVVEF